MLLELIIIVIIVMFFAKKADDFHYYRRIIVHIFSMRIRILIPKNNNFRVIK